MFTAMQTLMSEPLNGPQVLGVHMRHKIFFGAPFYELVTAAQHNEPPSAYAAWYFCEDPVAEQFPDGLWTPPFWDSRGVCDSQRNSWHSALQFQLGDVENQVGQEALSASASQEVDSRASRVAWCNDG